MSLAQRNIRGVAMELIAMHSTVMFGVVLFAAMIAVCAYTADID